MYPWTRGLCWKAIIPQWNVRAAFSVVMSSHLICMSWRNLFVLSVLLILRDRRDASFYMAARRSVFGILLRFKISILSREKTERAVSCGRRTCTSDRLVALCDMPFCGHCHLHARAMKERSCDVKLSLTSTEVFRWRRKNCGRIKRAALDSFITSAAHLMPGFGWFMTSNWDRNEATVVQR